MFTWNFQYISKVHLAESFNQLLLNSAKEDVLIRIHTAIHLENEAVDLARFIKSLVPMAHIYGTSASAVINGGKIIQNQCVISVTLMGGTRVKTALLPISDTETGRSIPTEDLCKMINDAVVSDDTKLLLTFFSGGYLDIKNFVSKTNDLIPGIPMIGGIANTSDTNIAEFINTGYVFNETGFSSKGVIIASISGEELDVFSGCASGVESIGEEFDLTQTDGSRIISINGKDAASEYRAGIGNTLTADHELANIFPFVYSDSQEIPTLIHYSKEGDKEIIKTNHLIPAGQKMKRAFIYDKKIVSDNRSMFTRLETFEKCETIFGYSCIGRAVVFPKSTKWELSIYEDSNICGCLTDGEITCLNGKNTYANMTFVVAAFGETRGRNLFNPYAFSATESIKSDNSKLLNYLFDMEKHLREKSEDAPEGITLDIIREYEKRVLYSDEVNAPNAASLHLDLGRNGYDRVCLIDISDISGLQAVFPENILHLTYKEYISKCLKLSERKKYRCYVLEDWKVAISAASFLISLSDFVKDMEMLQKELFTSADEYIPIIPEFCIIDDCLEETIKNIYFSAKVEMTQKNIQFFVCNAKKITVGEETLKENYHIINVINHAITNDKIIPYYQGIYDNNTRKLHHYEALMRIEDENGNVYVPFRFLDVARKYGLLYDTMSTMMIMKVFNRFKDVESTGVSVNIGIRDLKNQSLMEYIFDFLSSAKHPENFIFEILENEDIGEYEEIIGFVSRIHTLGAKIAIDDFGSGYSNLQHILSINMDYLKIDGSIVRNVCDNPDSENLISLISGWRKLSARGFQIVAEYVENEMILDIMQKFEIDYSQGYYFDKPSPDIHV